MSKLWIPGMPKPKKKVLVCLDCGREFPMAHTARFARHHEVEHGGLLEEDVKARESNVFTGLADPEAQRWIRKRLSEGKPGAKNGRPT